MKLFYYALLSAATPLALSLGVPSASSEQVNQLAARADFDAAHSSLVDGALPKRNLAKRDITGITRQCYGTNGKFKYILQGVLITTSIVGNTLHYTITTSLAGSSLKSVIFDLGHGSYELLLGDRGTFEFAQGALNIYAGRR
ncbi:hypothetical protein CC77DRAFT_1012300 [Alternaria alternata]|uniref:Uncharacterized protein n=1 Tax=Alternaria alternata TaxID=5599 RepID=A0A177DBZ4_ALTAL|nr:hypothetical protein CC77DRAFT_1012300 [Alternaria alternata]OAG16707.1 hypothetical protein CC77DRAFT_1012300 [Alternaria alternata]RYN48552.1 hypothetical protein AA0118_g11755 [Alternaria tenuissima]